MDISSRFRNFPQNDILHNSMNHLLAQIRFYCMKKIIYIFFVFFLVGCSVVEPSPEDIIAKAVIQTLSAIPPAIKITQVTPIPSVIVTLPAPTQKPFIQIENLQNPQTIKTITPTQISFKPVIQDHFTKDAAGFGIAEKLDDETMRMEIVDGYLNIYPKMKEGWRNWRLRPPEISNGFVEVKFKFNTCHGADLFGIVVRAPDYSKGNGYYGSISCDGRIQIQRNESTLAAASVDQKVLKINEFNVLKLVFIGNQIEIYLNGEKTAEAEDDLLKRGYCGFFTAPMAQNSMSISVDDFSIYSQK